MLEIQPDSRSRTLWRKIWLWPVVVAVAFVVLGLTWRACTRPHFSGNRIFKIGIENAPPYQTVDASGRESGVAVEILKRAAQRVGVKLDWVKCNGGPDLNLTSGAVDLWPLVAVLPERRSAFHISEPWLGSECWIVTAPGGAREKLENRANYTLIIPDNRPSRAFAETNFPGAPLVPKADVAAVLEAVQKGEGEVGLIWNSKAAADKMQAKDSQHGVGLQFTRVSGAKLLFGTGATLTQPDAAAAADALGREIEKMSGEGAIAAIYQTEFLEPLNEIDVLRIERDGRRNGIHAIVAIAGLVWLVALLIYQARLLRQSREATRRAERAKSDFLANMSHEIRTPLNSIVGMAEILQATMLTPQQKECLGLLTNSADTLLGLVNDVLDFSKLEAGTMTLAKDPVDIEELAESAIKAFALRAHQKRLELILEISGDCPQTVEGDRARLLQVLMNLLSNAVKFTEDGEVVLSVTLQRYEQKNCLQFSISDTGIGISASAEKAMFVPFSQADSSTTRRYGGTGLGLVLARRFVGIMGGRIWYDKRAPRGTSFHVAIPAISAEPASLALPCGGPNQLKGINVLVLDDNKKLRDHVQSTLKAEGAVVHTCFTVGETMAVLAEAQAAAQPFHVLLADCRVPGQEVLGLISALKADSRYADCAVVWMLTADDTDTLTKGRTFGAEAFVKKPLIKRELLDTIIRAGRKIPGTAAGGLVRFQAAGDPAVSKYKLRVLVVEDNPVNLKVMQALLARHGHDVVVAEDGSKALELWHAGTFDLVFMDVQMPGMDGRETTKAIRAQEGKNGKHVPIVAMTACAMKEDEERCFEAGMDGYLTKPISARKVTELLEKLQNERERRHGAKADEPPAAPPRGL